MYLKRERSVGLLAGLVLVALGILLLLDQLLRVTLLHYLWPLLFVAVGALFFAGMFTREREAGGLAIPGTMFIILGLIFLYQVSTGHWSSWAYIWTLIAPTGVGIGLMIYGRWSNRPGLSQAGLIVTVVGFAMFLVLGAFFEILTSMMGYATPGRFLWPVVMIAAGILLLFGKRLLRWLPAWATRDWIVDSHAKEMPASQLSTQVKDVTPNQSS